MERTSWTDKQKGPMGQIKGFKRPFIDKFPKTKDTGNHGYNNKNNGAYPNNIRLVVDREAEREDSPVVWHQRRIRVKVVIKPRPGAGGHGTWAGGHGTWAYDNDTSSSGQNKHTHKM